MKQTWNSFLQTVFQSIKMLSASAPAKRRRDTAVLTAGILLVTAITFAAGSFPETGNGAMVAFAEGTHDGNTDEEKRDPESIMAAEEAADTENGTETRKEEAENGAETPEGGEAGEGEDPDQEAETAAEGSGAQEEAAAGEDSGAPEGEAAESAETSLFALPLNLMVIFLWSPPLCSFSVRPARVFLPSRLVVSSARSFSGAGIPPIRPRRRRGRQPRCPRQSR